MKRLMIIFLLAVTGYMLVVADSFAAVPNIMNFQGKATDKEGAPLGGSYNLTFRIYNAAAGGTAKWTETQSNIVITSGIFQVQLGSITPLTLPFDEAYWISLEINSDGEMSPRTKLASVPYAYKAESLTEAPVIPFYRKGFDIEYIDFNLIKISAGVMDVAGKMFATTAYSNPILLEYADSPKNRDWIHGSKIPNSTAYVYACNDNGRVAFKFSDEAPNVSDQYGNTAQKPYLYRRYPDTGEGIGYRYIGQIPLDNTGIYDPGFIISSDATPQVPRIQIFTSSGTFKKPGGVTRVFVEVVGGGGGVDGSTVNETSSFGSFCSATGGRTGQPFGPTPGGTGIGGDINIPGGEGGHGPGGDAGGGFGKGGHTTGSVGSAGGNYGGGGASNYTSYFGGGGGGYAAKICTLTDDVTVTVGVGGGSSKGGAGAPGIVIVRW